MRLFYFFFHPNFSCLQENRQRRRENCQRKKKVELDRVRMMKNFYYSSFGSIFMFLVLPAGKEIDFDENNKKTSCMFHLSSFLAFHLFEDDKSDFHIQFSCHLVSTLGYAFLPAPASSSDGTDFIVDKYISSAMPCCSIGVVLSPPHISPSFFRITRT